MFSYLEASFGIAFVIPSTTKTDEYIQNVLYPFDKGTTLNISNVYDATSPDSSYVYTFTTAYLYGSEKAIVVSNDNSGVIYATTDISNGPWNRLHYDGLTDGFGGTINGTIYETLETLRITAEYQATYNVWFFNTVHVGNDDYYVRYCDISQSTIDVSFAETTMMFSNVTDQSNIDISSISPVASVADVSLIYFAGQGITTCSLDISTNIEKINDLYSCFAIDEEQRTTETIDPLVGAAG